MYFRIHTWRENYANTNFCYNYVSDYSEAIVYNDKFLVSALQKHEGCFYFNPARLSQLQFKGQTHVVFDP